MKKLHALSLFFFLLVGINNISAQRELTQGSLTIGITELETSDQQAASMLPMFKSSTMKFDFNDVNSLMTMDMMSGMMKIRVLLDNKTQATTMLMDMMGQKTMTKISSEDAKKNREDQKMNPEDIPVDFNVTYDKKDTKTIEGHKCFKANIDVKPKDAQKAEDVDLKITAYVTEEIKFPNAMIKSFEDTMGQGSFKMTEVPLEISISFNDGKTSGKITLAATEIKKMVEAGTFKLDTTGYEEMSMEDMMKNGGMGF